MLTALLVTALVASALGPASGAGLSRSAAAQPAPYTVQVLKGGRYAGPAALISDQYVICAASLIGNANAASLKVSTGNWFTDKAVAVDAVLVHPLADSGVDVAVLTLAQPLAGKNLESVSVVASAPPPPGSLAVVSGWLGWGWWQHVATAREALVLPRYCNASAPAPPAALCATSSDSLERGALLTVDGRLAGLASAKGKGAVLGVVSYVDLAEPSVQKFIAAATDPGHSTVFTTEEPTVPTRPTEQPTEKPTVPTRPTEQPTEKPTEKPKPSGKICSIRINGTNEPIVLKDGEVAFREPDSGDAVVLAAGERVRFVCSGAGNGFANFKGSKDLTAECVQDDELLINGRSVAVQQLSCKSVSHHSARKAGTCGDNGQFTRIQIGFEAGDDFAVQIENCFDSRTFDAVYSRSVMTPAIAGHESHVSRPSFLPTFYENLQPNALYVRKNQRSAIAQLLGSDELANKYVRGDNTHFLARGHLSAKADYILGAQQRATFYYINAAPQWQTFNGDNWEKLEDSVRQWVVSSGRAAHVITGTWGTATLPNKDGVETELYLQADKKYIRVPKYYWKVVYDPATKEAAAFVGLNNPYHVTEPADVLCKDVCDRYTWLSWRADKQEAGNGFCCDVNELRKVITTIPADIEALTLL